MPAPGAYPLGWSGRYPLHTAAWDGRLAELAAELTAKHAEGTLAAWPPPQPPTPSRLLCPGRLSHPRRMPVSVWRQC